MEIVETSCAALLKGGAPITDECIVAIKCVTLEISI